MYILYDANLWTVDSTCHFTRQNTYTLDYRERWVLIDLQAKIDLNIGTMIFNVFDTLKHKMCGDRRHTTNAQTLIWRINFSTGTPANELVFYSSWANIIYLRCNTPPISMHVNVPVIFQHMDFTHTQHGIWRYCNELQTRISISFLEGLVPQENKEICWW